MHDFFMAVEKFIKEKFNVESEFAIGTIALIPILCAVAIFVFSVSSLAQYYEKSKNEELRQTIENVGQEVSLVTTRAKIGDYVVIVTKNNTYKGYIAFADDKIIVLKWHNNNNYRILKSEVETENY